MSNLFVDGSKLLFHLEELNDWTKGKRIAPLHVEISPSSACNQRCTLCCVDYLGHKSVMLSEAILSALPLQMKEAGVKSVLLAGEGEPLANPYIPLMIERAHEQKLDMALNSNGVLLTPQMSDRILDKLVWARFSLQASHENLYHLIHRGAKGDFDRFCHNFSYATRRKKQLGLSVTLGIQQILINENFRDVLQTAKLAKDLGADYYIVKRFSKHPSNSYDVPDDLYLRSVDLFEQIAALEDDTFKPIVRWNNFSDDCHRVYSRCIGLPFICQVLATGEVYPCAQFFHQKEYCYGNLSDQSFGEIVLGEHCHSIQKKIESCQDVSKCMSYCRHHSTNQFVWRFLQRPQHVNFI